MQSSLFEQPAPPVIDATPGPALDDLPACVWRGNALGSRPAAIVPSGYATLDAELPGGGWPRAALTEILPRQPGSGELRLLLPALADITRLKQPIIMVAPPHQLLAPALIHAGIDIDHVLVVHAERPADALWSAEQALKARHAGALLGWFPSARPEHLRRLQLAAGGSECLLFAFRPAAAQLEASPAPLRLRCEPGPSGQIVVHVFKRRGPPAPHISVHGRLHGTLARTLERIANRRRVSPTFLDHVVDSSVSSQVTTRPGVSALA